MRIRVVSDLHIEFGSWAPPPVAADAVVLAGDIHTKGGAVDWALQHFDIPVVLVAGNHDFWGGSLGHTLDSMRKRVAGTHVHVLSDEAVVLQGVRFLGATLWTDYELTGGNEPLATWDAPRRVLHGQAEHDEAQPSARHPDENSSGVCARRFSLYSRWCPIKISESAGIRRH